MNPMDELRDKIKSEKDSKMKQILIEQLRKLKLKAISHLVNGLALVLIVLGFCVNSSMPYWLTEIHGSITGIILLGTIIFIKDARNNK